MERDLQDIVDEVARISGAPVTLEDREFNLVAFAAHRDAGDAVRQDSILHRRSTPQVRHYFESFGIARSAAPIRVPPDPERGLLGRLCVPVRWQSVTYGYLWLLEEPAAAEGGGTERNGRTGSGDGTRDNAASGGARVHKVDQNLFPELTAAAGRAGAEMARRARLRDDLGWKVGELLSTYPETRERAAQQIAESWSVPIDAPVAVVVLRAAETVPHPRGAGPRRGRGGGTGAAGSGHPESGYASGRDLFARSDGPAVNPTAVNAWRMPRTVLVGSGEHASTVIVPLSAPGDLSAAVSVARAAFAATVFETPAGPRRPDGSPRVVAGVGGSAAGLAEARGSWLQARIAARVAATRAMDDAASGATAGAAGPTVLDWSALGVQRLLGVGGDAALREALFTPGVERLFVEGGADLARTAAVYLDEAGSAQRTAEALGIHRQTLYHRLERIERVTGLDLSSGRDRLLLHLALTLAPGIGMPI